MSFQKSELPKGSPDALQNWEREWQELSKAIPAENREFDQVSAQARSAMDRWQMAMNMPQGWPIIQKAIAELSRLYEQGVKLRGDSVYGNVQTAMRQKYNLPSNQPLVAALEKEIDQIRDTPMFAPIADDLKKIVQALSENPKEVMETNPNRNTFFKKRGIGDTFIPDMAKVDNAHELIKKVRQSPLMTMRPNIATILDSIEAGVAQVEGVDPILVAQHRWKKNLDDGRKTNYYGLRVAGGIFGTLISGVGAAYCLIAKKPFSWPIAFWAGIAAISANPDLLKGRSDQSLNHIAAMYTPTTHELISGAFKGKNGAKAFDELQEIAASRPNDLKALQSTNNPSLAQIGALADNNNSSLVQALSGLTPEQRSKALQTFGGRRSKDEQEILREMMKNRELV